jgi:hypothetical protein
MWDKVRSYWEHLEQHLERTQWELDGITIETTKVQHPHLPQKKKTWAPSACCLTCLGCKNFYCILMFFWSFLPGRTNMGEYYNQVRKTVTF